MSLQFREGEVVLSKITEIKHDFRRALAKRNYTDKIVYHHQAGNEADATTIHRWHRNRQTSSGGYWAGIGYHYIIMRNGEIQTGRPHWAYGAHAGSSANGSSIGIMFTGNLDVQKPTQAQIDSAVWLEKEIIRPIYGKLRIEQHSDHMATSCAGKNFPMKEIKRRAIEEEVFELVSKYFRDIKHEWQATHVDSLREKGIVSGRTADTYDPDSPVTRAELAVVVNKAIDYLSK